MRYQLERFGFWLFRRIAGVLPRRWFLAAGRAVGWLAFYLDRRHRSVALQNFAVAFPETSHAKAKKIIRQCYQFFGSYLFDMLTFFSGFPPERMRDFEYEGLDHVESAYARGKGAIFFTAHWGAWELMAIAHGYKGYSLGVIARKLDNPYLEALLQKLRACSGNFVIDKKEGFRPMLKAMRAGKGIAILIDQNVTTEDRIFVDFFGKPASTTPALALLKLKTDAALIPVFALPLPENRYRFIYGEPVEVPLTGNRDEDVVEVTQACTQVIQRQIVRYPEYWLWMHRRWKTRPVEDQAAPALQTTQA